MHKIKNRARYYTADKRDVRREVSNDESYAGCYADLVTPSRVAIGREDLDGVERLFSHLSEEHRQVIVPAKVVGLSHSEIAAKIGKTEEASRMLLSRALVRLSGLLHRHTDGGADA